MLLPPFPRLLSYAAALAGLLAAAAWAAPDAAYDLGTRRELFADGFLVDRLSGGAELRLHHPEPREIVLVHDAPWEGNHSLNYSVFRDGDRYRMYYSTTMVAMQPDPAAPPGAPPVRRQRAPSFCCYAESDDGTRWRKPALGLVEFGGSRANNILFQREQLGALTTEPAAIAVMKDGNPAAPPEARYKAFVLGLVPGDAYRGLLAYQSPDGIHWRPLQTEPILTAGSFDGQNVVFWDAARGRYRAYWRAYYDPVTGRPAAGFGGLRGFRTGTSADLRHWDEIADLAYPGSPPQHLYTSQVQPYPRAPHLYVGFPSRYVEPLQRGSLAEATAPAGPDRTRRWPASLRALPELADRELRAGISERFGSALTEGMFMAGRDGVTFRRWDEAFIRPGIERPGTWTSGQNYLSWPLVETASALAGAPPELSLYGSESYWTGTSSEARRYSLRLDGFVSVWAPYRGGEVVTRPVRFAGRRLTLNFATSAAGGVQVEIQDLAGRALPGFAREDCAPLFGDTLERAVAWGPGADLAALAGRPVRLCFVLRDADLYAFQFQE
ncbi:MAG: hypothetical protein JNG83_12400 [Opitutaceae bacterium]|nr:hypothetical protein [Opitutaceae bacterium]